MAPVEVRRNISPRELEILDLICNQYTTPEIARKLFISPRTVDGHRYSLLSKIPCKNTAGLVAFAVSRKLVDVRF